MENDIKIDIITEDGERFTIYDGNNPNEARQSEKFASLVVDKSNVPAIVLRSTKINDKMSGSEKLMAAVAKTIAKKIIRLTIDKLRDNVDFSITKDDLRSLNYIKDDPEIDGRIIIMLDYGDIDVDDNKIAIEGLKNGILSSPAHSFAEVQLNDDRVYYIYTYPDSEEEAHTCVSMNIEDIWEKMAERGYTNSYIALLTRSHPFEVQKACGLEIEDDFIEKYIEFEGFPFFTDTDEEDEDGEDQ